MDEKQAYALAQRVVRTPGYRVLEVRRAWSAAAAWQVEAEDRRTGERLLLLDESQFDRFDSRLTADSPTTAHPLTAHAARSSSTRPPITASRAPRPTRHTSDPVLNRASFVPEDTSACFMRPSPSSRPPTLP